MTTDEALKEMMRRFPEETVNATHQSWFYIGIKRKDSTYRIVYNFSKSSCTSKESGESFEDCFSQLDKEIEEINRVIKERGILFRKF